MNIHKQLKRSLFPALKIAYAGIVSEGGKAYVSTQTLKNRKVVKEEKREFELPGGQPTGQMLDYLNALQKNHTYAYTATLLSSINQGAVPGCDKALYRKLGISTENLITVSKDNLWSIYASELDIADIQRRYEPIDGVDFIFPSEALVDFLRQKPHIGRPHKSDETLLYLLYEKNAATLAIYSGEVLTYSSHFVFDEDEEELIEDDGDDMGDLLDEELDEEGIQEEIVELDTISDHEDLGGIEDLDDFIASDDSMDMDSFDSVDESMLDEESMDASSAALPDDSFFDEEPQSNLKKDMLLFNFIKNSVQDFYHNEHFASNFITRALIYDTHKGGKGLGRFLSEDLYIEAETHDINLPLAICELAIEEAAE